MKKKTLFDKDNKILAIFSYDKYYINSRYEIFFNTENGFELIQGTKGKPDPLSLNLPALIDVGIMGSCLNTCPFCYQGDQIQAHMYLDDFKRIIDETKHHVNQVALGGRGDPNLHPFFKEIVEYARANNVVPNYTTSGVGLTEEQIEISKLCGAVAVSNYGKPETFAAINRFIDAGIKTNIHFLLTKGSYFDAIKILNGLNPWMKMVPRAFPFDLKKINAIVFLLFKPQGKGKRLNWEVDDMQMKVLSKKIIDHKAVTKIGMDSCLINKITNHVVLPTHMKMTTDFCEAARMSMYITPDMKAMPCSFADESQKVSLKGTTIARVWNTSDVFLSYRNVLKKKPNCCPVFCGGC